MTFRGFFVMAKLLETTFVYTSDFDLTLNDSGTASIRFSPKDAPYVRDNSWSGDQSIVDHSDDSCTLTLSNSGTRDLFWWLLSFGSGAKVLSPPELCDALREESVKLAGLYDL